MTVTLNIKMDMKNITISFVIRTRNVEIDLPRCLDSIIEQNNPTDNILEFIIVDNESTDGTLKIVKKYDAKVVSISQDEFTWGRALNKGIEKASGDIVILISADVSAENDMWLTEMIEPFSNEMIAAVYAKQIPRVDAPLDERVRLSNTFPDQSIIFDETSEKIMASNACAAIRKTVWDDVHYDEEIEGGEEIVWTKKIQENNLTYMYNSKAIVYHSHRERASRFAYRIWELHRKDVRLGKIKPGMFYTLYAVAAIVKRRLLNAIKYKNPMNIKVVGVISLVPETFFFLLISILEGVGIKEKTVRRWMW